MRRITILSAALILGLFSCNQPEGKKTTAGGPTLVQIDSQAVFCLSMISNLPAATYVTQGSLDKKLIVLPAKRQDTAAAWIINYCSSKMDSTLQYATDNTNGQNLKLSNWKRVWGPAVSVNQSDILAVSDLGKLDIPYVSSSSMTVFQDTTNKNNYVIAIQATNQYSNRDWIAYDANVKNTQPWSSVVHKDTGYGVISMGTYNGLNALLALQSNNQNIVQFVSGLLSSGNKNIIVTGHSLGGALSPALALMINDSLDTGKNAATNNIFCLSTAGATPGDTAFASHYNNTMMANTMRVWNFYDVVPRAWGASTLNPVKSGNGSNGLYSTTGASYLYDSAFKCGNYVPSIPFTPITTPDLLNALVDMAIAHADSSGYVYQYICNNGYSFNGADTANSTGNPIYVAIDTSHNAVISYLENLLSLITHKPVDFNTHKFLCQMAAQHIASYSVHFKIKQIHEYMKGLIQHDYRSAMYYSCSSITPPTAFTGDPYGLFLGCIYLKAWGW